MSRWSPTVVAEAPPPVTSGLATVLGMGLSSYRKARDEREAKELAAADRAEAQRRYEEESGFRKRAEERGVQDSALARAMAGYNLTLSGAEKGLLTAMPTGDDPRLDVPPPMRGSGPPMGRPVRDSGLGDVSISGRPSGLGMVDRPNLTTGLGVQEPRPEIPRAGNTGPGGQPSQSQFPWEIEKRNWIKQQAESRWPGTSGTTPIKDPISGETKWYPARQKWVDAEVEKLDAQVAAARQKVDEEDRLRTRAKEQYEMTHGGAVQLKQMDIDAQIEAAKLKATADAEKNKGEMTNQAKMKVAGDNASIIRLRSALAGVAKNPDALGWKTLFPELALQKIWPGGVDARAELADAIIAFRRSNFGLAVSQHEATSGKPLLPIPGEDPAITARKIHALIKGNEADRKAIMEIYGQDYTPLFDDSGPRSPLPGEQGAAVPRGAGPLSAPAAAAPAPTTRRTPNLSRY